MAGVGVSILTARLLGPAGRGQYFYVITLVNLIAQASALGLQTSNTYFAVKQPELLNKLVLNSAWISLVVSGMLSLLVVSFLYFIAKIPGDYLWFTLGLAPTYLFFLIGVNLLIGINKVSEFNFFQIFTNAATIVAVAIAGYWTSNLNIVLSAVFLAWLIVAVSLFKNLYTRGKEAIKFYRDVFSEGFSYSFKSYLIALSTFLVLRINVFFLQQLASPDQLGYFSIAAQITDAIALLPMTVGLILFPRLLRADNGAMAFDKMIAALKMIGGVMVILCLFIWLLAPYFIKFLFGVKFMPAISPLGWLLPGSFFYSLIAVLAQYLAARGQPKLLVITWFLGIITNAVLSYCLIPLYAANGAGLALSVSYSVVLVLCCYLVWIEKKAEPREINSSEKTKDLGFDRPHYVKKYD